LPVLDVTIGLLEHSYMVTVTDIADKAALDPSVVAQALDALDPVYVDFRKTTTGGDPRFWYVFKVTPEARRVVGQWPTAESLVSRLAEELSAAARREGDAEHQGLLMYAARLIGDTLRDAAVRAAGAVLEPAFGGIPVPEMGQQVPPPEPQPEVEFHSLVPLPELPELLRPQRPDRAGEVAFAEPPPGPMPVTAPGPMPVTAAVPTPAAGPMPVTAAGPTPAPEPKLAPEPTPALEPIPRPDSAARKLPAREPAVLKRSTANPYAPERTTSAEPTAAPTRVSTNVPDLSPWPDAFGPAEKSPAAQSEAPEVEPTPFRSPLGIWPAADADGDGADTDLDMVQARRDAV
jgi:hypothetical protein